MHNYFASALYFSMGIVVATGIVGRYLFVMVPIDPRRRPLTHLALIDLSDRMKKQYSDLFGELDLAIKVNKILDMNYSTNLSLPKMFSRIFTIWAYRYLKLILIFKNGKKEIKSKSEFNAFKKYSLEMARLHLQMEISPSVKRVLSYWRSGHALLALMTITLVIVHIFVEIWVGY